MYRKYRPGPLSPSREKQNRELYIPDSRRVVSLSPRLDSPCQEKSAKLTESISKMKIFDENNDEGKPEHTWIQSIKAVHNPKLVEYNVIQSVTLRPDQLKPTGIYSFNQQRKSPVIIRK